MLQQGSVVSTHLEAFVEPSTNVRATYAIIKKGEGDVDAEAIISFCEEKLSRYKLPRKVELILQCRLCQFSGKALQFDKSRINARGDSLRVRH